MILSRLAACAILIAAAYPLSAVCEEGNVKDAAPQAAIEASALPAPSPEASSGEGVMSIHEQVDPARSALPARDENTHLRLKLDTIELEELYEALRQEVQRDSVRMSLRECVALTLEGNQDILVTEYAPWKAEADIFAARGEFDPIASGTMNYTKAEKSMSAEVVRYGGLPRLEIWNTTGQASVGGKLPWGTQYGVALDMSKEETPYNNYVEEWTGSLSLNITQPLLRGRGKAVNLARIRIAANSRAQSESQVRIQAMSSVADVVRAYWDLVGTIQAVEVRKQSLENAERLLEINEKRREIEVGSGMEVVQAKAGVATRQSELISARSTVFDAEDQLKNLMSMKDGGRLSGVHIVPIEQPSTADVELAEEQSIELALSKRPEINAAELAIDSAEIQRHAAANDLQPQLDVTGSLSQGGRGHYASDVFDGIKERDDNAYSIGLKGAVSLGNKAARGAYQRTKLEKREAQQRLEKTQQDIMTTVRMAVRNVATSRILVESNKQARRLQETNVDAGEKRLKLGVITSFELLRLQEDLAMAQLQELQSLINYEKALVDLRLAEGVLLEELGVAFDLAEAEQPVTYIRSLYPIDPH